MTGSSLPARGVELLFRRGGVDRRPLAEGADRFDQFLFRGAVALEHLRGCAALGHQTQQQVLDRRIFVAEVLGEVDGFLDRPRDVLREELFAAALHAGQCVYGTFGLLAQSAYVDADAPQEECRQRIVLAHENRKQVERFDSLLPPLARQRKRRLERFLRLDGQSVDIHCCCEFCFAVSRFSGAKDLPRRALRTSWQSLTRSGRQSDMPDCQFAASAGQNSRPAMRRGLPASRRTACEPNFAFRLSPFTLFLYLRFHLRCFASIKSKQIWFCIRLIRIFALL